MAIKMFCRLLLLTLGIFVLNPCEAQSPLGQVLQISTHFTSLIGKPTWLLIVRDEETGLVSPYIFDIRNNDNYWVAFTFGRTYRVTSSSLKFGPYAKITNFCNLENGIISGKSYWVTLSGVLTPDVNTVKCRLIKYKNDLPYTIVDTP